MSPPNQARLDGRICLITGSGRGLGAGIAVELGKRGASVVVNYAKSSSAANKVVAEIESYGSKAVAIQADVSSPPSVAKLFSEALAHFGRIDMVVSNSGTEIFKPEEDVTEEDYDRVFALNTRAQFFVAQAAYKNVAHGGRIVLTSSVAATMTGIPNHALYAGSKAAVEGFVRSFAVDCGHKGITVNAIAPGGIKSDMYTENAWHYVPGADPSWPVEAIDRGLANFCPLRRVGVPDDVAKVIAFLAGPDSEWINGQVLKLSGGSPT
ncbi:Arp2/3 complex subunit, actin nucleation center [Bachmanniomyces sp. S44760]|nr:Arp2/3 complex subunit, actin nucleation center [Bachmanniomyces sp. S44760]